MKERTLRLSNEELRSLCIRNEWFYGGTNDQYEKLFEMNRDGANLETLAIIIWTCSDGHDLTAIQEELHTAAAWPIYLSSVDEALRLAAFGDTEREIILDALRTNSANGVCYRTVEG